MTFFLFQNTLSFYGRNHLPLTDGPSIKCVIKKTFFAFHLNSYENWWICSYQCVLKLHQVSLNSNEKLFFNDTFYKGRFVKGRWIRPKIYFKTHYFMNCIYYYYMISFQPYLCESFYVLLEYARTAMFHWFFIEGLHLHNVLTIDVFPASDGARR